MIEKEKLDAVMIETTTHARAWIAILAMQAGMDAYIEKPIGLTIAEGRAMADAAQKLKRVTQVGTQQRSMPIDNWASDLVKNGAIGKSITVLAPNFVGPFRWTKTSNERPQRPGRSLVGRLDQPGGVAALRPGVHNGWGNWWDFDGGGMCFGVTGWGAHSYDQVNRALGTDDTGPTEIVLEEPVAMRDTGKFAKGPTVGGAAPGLVGDTDTGLEWRDMAKITGPRAKVTMKFAGGAVLKLHLNGDRGPGLGAIFIGEKGKIEINRNHLASNPKDIILAADNPGANKRPETSYHLENWVECIKSRKKCNADIEIGQRGSTLCCLVNIVREIGRVGEPLKWDPAAERFTNCDEANKLLQHRAARAMNCRTWDDVRPTRLPVYCVTQTATYESEGATAGLPSSVLHSGRSALLDKPAVAPSLGNFCKIKQLISEPLPLPHFTSRLMGDPLMLRSTTTMTLGPFLFLLGVLFPPFAAQAAAEVEEGFTPIFNGKDLTGWDGKFANWHVAEGAITGENSRQRPCTKCNYLFWRGGKPADFELRCLYRVSARGNSGIQFRSRELPDFNVAGYQADIEGGPELTGTLYDCNGRHTITWRGQKVVIGEDGKREITTFGDPNALQKLIKLNDWNDYRIVARGAEITLTINGAVMSRTIDREKGKATRVGLIALQLHNGPLMKVQFKKHSHPELPPLAAFPELQKRGIPMKSRRIDRRRFLGAASAAAAGVSLPCLIPSRVLGGPGRPGANEIRQRGCDRLRRSRVRRCEYVLGSPDHPHRCRLRLRVSPRGAICQGPFPRRQVGRLRGFPQNDRQGEARRRDGRDDDPRPRLDCRPSNAGGARRVHREADRPDHRRGAGDGQGARKLNRVTQVGTQQRSMPMNNWASDLVKNGAIGKILTVIAPNYCGPERWTKTSSAAVKAPAPPWWDVWTNQAPLRPYDRDIHRGWGRWWDYDGGGGNFGVTGWGAHAYDQINRALGTDDAGPVEATLDEPLAVRDAGKFVGGPTVGGVRFRATGDIDARGGVVSGDTGADWVTEAKLRGPRAKVSMKFANGTELKLHLNGDRGPGLGAIFVGEKGKIEINRNRIASNPKELVRAADNPGPNKRAETSYHVENWGECVRSRKKCNADIAIGQRLDALLPGEHCPRNRPRRRTVEMGRGGGAVHQLRRGEQALGSPAPRRL